MCGGQNWGGFRRAGREWRIFSVGIDWLSFELVVETDQVFVYVREITCFSCEYRNYLSFCVGGRNWLDFSAGDGTWLNFSVGMKWIWLLRGRLKFTWLLYRDRDWLGFCVTAENYLLSVPGSINTRFWYWSTEIDLILKLGSLFTWFQWRD